MISCSHALTIEREQTENNENHFVPTLTELKYGILYFAGLFVIVLFVIINNILFFNSVRIVPVLVRLFPLNRGDPVTLCHRFYVRHVRRRHYQRATMRGAVDVCG